MVVRPYPRPFHVPRAELRPGDPVPAVFASQQPLWPQRGIGNDMKRTCRTMPQVRNCGATSAGQTPEKQEGTSERCSLFSDTDRTQTCNLLIRSQMLYSIKLRRLSFIASANVA